MHITRNLNRKISHLFLLTEKSTKTALNAFLFLSSCDRSCRSGTHGRLHVQMWRRQLSNRQSDAGEVVLVQTVLAAVAWGQWGRGSSRIQCAVVMLPMPAAWSANLISISTLIAATTFARKYSFFYSFFTFFSSFSTLFLSLNIFIAINYYFNIMPYA